MPLMRFSEVSLAFGLKPLLDHVSFALNPGERVCLVGRNGEGKSTLMGVATGSIVADSGDVWFDDGVKVAMLPQDLPQTDQSSVWEVVASGLPELLALTRRFEALTQNGDHSPVFDQVMREIDAMDGWNFNARVDTAIKRFGLVPEKKMSELSGGWRRRVLLAKATLCDPDVLFLDEPTNHLDIPAIAWLEQFLKDFRGALLFISHDRAFIRALATRMIELDRGNLTSWEVGYDKYLELKAKALEEEARANALFDKKLADEEVWIRQGIKARRTRNEGRVRALKRLREERLARRERTGNASISVEDARRSGRLVAQTHALEFGFAGAPPLFANVNLTIMRGDKVGLIGENGTGKTTFLRLLMGQLQPTSGSVRQGTNLEVAYFDQLRQQLDPARSIIDNVAEGREFVTINGQPKHIISYLNDFLFTAERARTPVSALSGGETNRLLLAKLFSKPANLLVMDEPTNDLDVETLELLEGMLVDYSGTLLITSHDREFINNVATSTLYFDGKGAVQEFVGGYDDWVHQSGGFSKKLDATDVSEKKPTQSATNSKVAEVMPAVSSVGKKNAPKLSYKHKLELEGLPARIEALESEIEGLRQQVASGDFYARSHEEVTKTLEQLASLEASLEQIVERWVELESLQEGGGA